MIDGMRTGFLLYPNSTDRILPITHVNLVIDSDGKSLGSTLKKWQEVIANLQASVGNGGILSVDTYNDLLALDADKLKNGAICYVSDLDTYYRYAIADGWQVMTTNSQGEETEDIYSHIWIGPDPPADDRMLWLDTNSDGIIEGEDDLNLLYALYDKVNELETELAILRGRVDYLEHNGTKPIDPVPGPGTDEDDIILLEDGTELLLEDGSNLLLEIQVIDEPDTTSNDAILMEDGTEILLEDGSLLLMEIQNTEVEIPTTEKKALLFEDGTEVLSEDGTTILLEMQ